MDDARPDSPPQVGSILEDRYRLVGMLGEGGIGWVYRAEHLKLGHAVAIKMLQTQFVGHDQLRPRFEREAKALAALSHPNVVTLTDYSIANDRPYLVMELLEGRTLAEALRKGPFPEMRARHVMRQVLSAVAYAHGRKFAHRDLKPENVFLVSLPSDPDFVKVLDFGFVQLVHPDPTDPQAKLTRTGFAFGTPSYMSPEQASGDRTGPASDVYSLGIILHEVLTGQAPFQGSLQDIVRQHLSVELPPLAVAGLEAGPELRALLAKATAKSPAARFPSAIEMLAAFEALPTPMLVPAGSGSYPLPAPSAQSPSRPERPTLPERPAVRPPRRAQGGLARAAIASAVLAGVALLAFAVYRSRSGEQAAESLRELARTHAPELPALPELPELPENPLDLLPRVDSTDTPTTPSATTPTAPDEADDDEASPTERAAGPEIVEAPDTNDASDATLGPNPWATRPRVALLWNAQRQVARGRTLSSSLEHSLKRWARSHRGDPRPHLLLAAHYFRKRYEESALERYLLAQRVASDARNDPRMLRHLVALASDGAVTSRAADAVVELYGSKAIPAVQRALAAPNTSAPVQARLRRLQARL